MLSRPKPSRELRVKLLAGGTVAVAPYFLDALLPRLRLAS